MISKTLYNVCFAHRIGNPDLGKADTEDQHMNNEEEEKNKTTLYMSTLLDTIFFHQYIGIGN